MKTLLRKSWLKHVMVLLSGVLVLLMLALTSIQGNASRDDTPILHEEWLEPVLQVANQHDDKVVVSPGDTAGKLLTTLGFSANQVAAMIKASAKVYPLSKIHVGHLFKKVGQGDKTRVIYQVDAGRELVLRQQGDTWQAQMMPRTVFTRTSMVEGSIQDSLFYDAAKVGLDDALTMKLVDIFAWDIDFVRDLRKGDAFKVLYEESFDDAGKRVDYTILSAEFINRGHVYTAIRYTDKKGNIEYYDENGRNLRKTYLKAPVRYSRISSRFTTSRKHPVLGYTRAHRGVDYAAKTGTPIHAIGDGKVVYKGWKGGYGRFIEIRHTNGIHSTAYAHMSRYARGIRKGSYVKQGQVIGYVGMSGLATGPHLHFEFRSRGRAVNPLTVKHKAAKPVPKAELTAFRLHAKEVMQMMAMMHKTNDWGS